MNIVRLGTKYSGFYYPENLPKLNENSIIYCVGAGEDISHDIILSYKTKVLLLFLIQLPEQLNM